MPQSFFKIIAYIGKSSLVTDHFRFFAFENIGRAGISNVHLVKSNPGRQVVDK